METAACVASVIGPVVTLLGAWVLLKKHDVEKVWASVKATPSVLYIGGVMNLLIGAIVLKLSHSFEMNMTLLVTLFGLLQVVRGVAVLFMADKVVKLQSKMMKHLRMAGGIALVWGLALCWMAFGCCC